MHKEKREGVSKKQLTHSVFSKSKSMYYSLKNSKQSDFGAKFITISTIHVCALSFSDNILIPVSDSTFFKRIIER